MKNALVKINAQLATLSKLISILLPSIVSRIPNISKPLILYSLYNFVEKGQI